jgi:predicted ATPase
MPLAIELAAARMRMMTLEQLAAGLDDRFRLLVGSTRTAVPRHQTLRASVEWTYTLLSEAERLVLSRLAVFAGDFTLEAAKEVCSDAAVERHEILDIVTRLVDRSLVQVGEDASGARYRLLETIRQYAGERLASSSEQDVIRGRHLAYFAALADRADAEMQTTGLFRWLPVLDAEHDNLRAAFDWGVGSASSNDCLRLSSSPWLFWMVRGHLSEGRQRLEVALAAPHGDPVLRVNALIGAGH